MDIGSIGMANTSGWYNQAAQAVQAPVESTAAADQPVEMATAAQSSEQPVGDLYDWQGTVIDAYA